MRMNYHSWAECLLYIMTRKTVWLGVDRLCDIWISSNIASQVLRYLEASRYHHVSILDIHMYLDIARKISEDLASI